MVTVTGAAFGCAFVVACTTDYQKGLDDPRYGTPNALAGKQQPGSSSDPSSDQAKSGADPACVTAGGALVEAGTCAVSFKSEILALFEASGCTSITCHGGTNPANPPRIDPKDPLGTYAGFAALKMTNGRLYINPCSAVPEEAAIADNLDPAAESAERGVPMPQGSLGLEGAVQPLQTWLTCGSPNN